MKTIAFRLAILVACVWMFFAGSSFAQTGSQTTPFDPEKHKIISTDRPDGRYTSTRGLVQHMIRSQHPLLAFDPSFSRDEFWKLNNNDPPDHYFKADVAVPWLENRLKP